MPKRLKLDTVLSITSIIKPNKFVLLALVQLNLVLNRLTVELKSPVHNEKLRMFLKSLLNARAYLNGLIFAR